MAENTNYIGVAMGMDVTDLKAGLSEANKQIQLANSKFKAAASGMDDWTKSTEGLSAKVKQLDSVLKAQQAKLSGLEAEYAKVAREQGENSEAARKLQVQINNQKAVINQTQREFDNYTETLKQAEAGTIDLEQATLKAGKAVEKTGDEAKESGGKLDGLKSVAAGVGGGLLALGGIVAGAVGSFLSLAESTRETRENMAKLQTAFDSAGHSAEAAQGTYTELYGILGDEGAATEAAQQLAKLSKDEASLAANTRILTGVMAEYGSSIPTEGLAEGMAATAAMGEVQGVLADALEWQGVNLEDYNAQLGKLATEEERAAYIQQTLTDLYGESADAYAENNKSIIEARKAEAELAQTTAELGAIAEPIMTELKKLANSLLQSLMPFVELIGNGLAGALNGSAEGATMLAEGIGGALGSLVERFTGLLPTVLNVIMQLIPMIADTLIASLPTLLETVVNLITQIINLLSTLLPQIVTKIVEIIPVLIEQLIAAVPQLIEAATTLLMSIVNALPTIITSLIEALPSLIQTIIDALIASIPLLLDAAIQLLNAIVEAIPVLIESLVQNLPSIIETLINGLIEAIPLLLDAAIQLLFALIDAIPVLIEELVKNLPNIISTIISALVDAFPKLLSTAGELFGKLLTAAWDLIKKLPSVLGNIISTIVDYLVSPFKDMFGKMWDGLKDGAKKAWDGVKEIFSKVANFFGDIFGSAWKKVKDVFSAGGKIFDGIKDGILNVFKNVVNTIIRGINKVIKIPFDGINAALKKIKGIEIVGIKPFNWIKTFSVPQIPELEEGGVFKKGQVGLLEGKGAEAIVPLEKNIGWIKKVSERVSKTLASDLQAIKGNALALAHGTTAGASNNVKAGNTVVDARMTVNYNGRMSRKQQKQTENDHYTAVKMRLKAEGAI